MKMRENTGICISRIRPFCGGVNLQNWASSWFLLKWVRCQCDVSAENKFSKKPPQSASGTRPGAPSRIFQNTPKPPLFAQSGRKLFNKKKKSATFFKQKAHHPSLGKYCSTCKFFGSPVYKPHANFLATFIFQKSGTGTGF